MPGGFMGFGTSSGTLEKSVDAAISHAEIHWKKMLTSTKTKLTKNDDATLANAFREFFPNVDVAKINRAIFGGMNKSRWKMLERKVMNSLKSKEDVLTILRIDSRGAYTEENSIMVARLQFLCIEATRNRENLNKIDPRAILIDDLKERKKALMISFTNQDVRELVKWITQLRVSYPTPDYEMLSKSRITKTLTQISKIIKLRNQNQDGDEDVLKALNLVLSQWKVAISIQKHDETPLTKRLLSRLQSKALTTPSTTTATSSNKRTSKMIHNNKRIANLLRWANENGASHVSSDVGIVENEEKIRGLGTIRDVRSGEELYRVPLSLALTLDVAIRSDIGSLCRRLAFESGLLRTDEGVVLDNGSRFALALLIAHERIKGSTSFYAPWIESLPQEYDCLLMWDTNKELPLLQCPELIRSARRGDLMLRQVWKQIHKLIRDDEELMKSKTTRVDEISYEIFLWGYLTIESRSLSFGRQGRQRHPFGNFRKRDDDDNTFNLDDQIAVVPVFDLMNHESALQRTSPSFQFKSPHKLSYPQPSGFKIPKRLEEPLPVLAHPTYQDALKASCDVDEENAKMYDPENGFEGLNEERFGKVPAQCVSCNRWSTLQDSINEDLWIFESYYCLRCTAKQNKQDDDHTEWLPSDLSIVSTRNYKKGEQITFPYGRRLCSQELLMRYGFLTSSSSSLESVLMLELPAQACMAICQDTKMDCKMLKESILAMSFEHMNSSLSVPPVPSDLEKRCFWASNSWVGKREGYYFGSGTFGLGYYDDEGTMDGLPLLGHVHPGDMRCFVLHPLPYGVGDGWTKSAIIPYFRTLAGGDDLAALRLLETYLETRLGMFDSLMMKEKKMSYRETLALRFRLEQKDLMESHLKCLRLTLKWLSHESNVILSVSQLLKIDDHGLDESTMAEIILYVLKCSGKLQIVPPFSERSLVSSSGDGSIVVESILGVVKQ